MNKKLCPICGKPNNCAHANGEDPTSCWCMKDKITKDVLEELNKAKTSNNNGCFCKECVEKYKFKVEQSKG